MPPATKGRETPGTGATGSARALLFLALAVIAGTKMEVRGRANLPEGPVLVVAKHQSTWDTFALIPLFGLLQFKLGTGGEAAEYAGEWDYPLKPLLHKAFQLYLARR